MINKNAKKRSSSDALFYNIIDKILIVFCFGSVALFILYPLLSILKQSVCLDSGVSFFEFKNILENNGVLLENSLKVAFLVAIISTSIACVVAIHIRFTKGIKQRILTGLLLISMVSPPFVSALAYIQLFGRRGLITNGLLGLSITPYGFLGVVLMESVFFASLNALLLLTMLYKIDISLLNASLDLGASRSYTIVNIVLPLIKPALLICFLLSFIRSMADFSTPIVIGGRLETVATEIYMQMIGYSNLSRVAALNVLLVIPALIVFIWYRKITSKNNKIFSGTMNKYIGSEEFHFKGILAFIIRFLSSLFFVFLVLQYGIIFLGGFTKQIRGKMSFTTVYLEKVIFNNYETLLRSLCYAFIVATIGTIIGILITYYIERRQIRLANIFDFIVTMPYMLPGSCFGIGYILAFNKPPLILTNTGIIVIINMIFKQLSITTKATSAAMMQINRDIDNAARDLGANKMEVFRDVLLPNLKNGFMAGFINNFASAMTTVGAIIFLVSPGKKVAVFTLFDSINSGRYGEASMIASYIILITAFVNISFSSAFLRKVKR